MNRKLILFLIVTLLVSKGFAQTIERKIINSGGSTFSNSGTVMKTSIGEPVVGKKGNTNTMLSQGFYTGAFEYIFSAVTVPEQKVVIGLYPNPADNIIFLKGDLTKIETVEIFNSLGLKIMREQLSSDNIDLKNISAGIYFIHLLGGNHEIISSSKFIKARL